MRFSYCKIFEYIQIFKYFCEYFLQILFSFVFVTQGVKNNIHIRICIIYLLQIIFIFVFVHQKTYLLHSAWNWSCDLRANERPQKQRATALLPWYILCSPGTWWRRTTNGGTTLGKLGSCCLKIGHLWIHLLTIGHLEIHCLKKWTVSHAL